MVGILFKSGCYEYIADMDIEDALPIIEGVFIEYMDERIYQQYLFNNIMLQLNGNAMSYPDYLKKGKISLNEAYKETDYKKVKNNNNDILDKFKKQGGIITPN